VADFVLPHRGPHRGDVLMAKLKTEFKLTLRPSIKYDKTNPTLPDLLRALDNYSREVHLTIKTLEARIRELSEREESR
jgi:hypothetical protein